MSSLGVHEKGAVEVTNCLCIPHNESEDEVKKQRQLEVIR